VTTNQRERVASFAESVAIAVGVLGESFNRKITETTIKAYAIGLEGLSSRQVELATANALRSCKFFPSPFELRQLVGAISINDRAVLAWTIVFRTMASTGSYHSIDFDDPVINATIRSMGGWPRLSETPLDEMPFRQKEFERIYISLVGVGVDSELARPLPGLIEVDNATKGLGSPNPVQRIETGLPSHSRPVMRIENRGQRTVSGVVADVAKRLSVSEEDN
jgi:hypothetical protein